MIRYLPHAEEAMARRSIAREWVAETLSAPDWTEPDPRHADRTRSFKSLAALGGRVLRVVHWRDGPDIVVLTAHPDRDARNPARPR
jgi:hypothetical protein